MFCCFSLHMSSRNPHCCLEMSPGACVQSLSMSLKLITITALVYSKQMLILCFLKGCGIKGLHTKENSGIYPFSEKKTGKNPTIRIWVDKCHPAIKSFLSVMFCSQITWTTGFVIGALRGYRDTSLTLKTDWTSNETASVFALSIRKLCLTLQQTGHGSYVGSLNRVFRQQKRCSYIQSQCKDTIRC